ncbi:hypothetical protein K469DRAFT_722215 [Zopfia rhizophila CBS 207.26]|uniref:Uncharacterized protein n=1 Tax=Zopfia rhizophila CBS 207.26 TaxID=1314779 RepID=A0A6A6DG85_9PEZI|nr:hypothetical protein K469DRAFT_722215 [Zopfia rhizophila CBS 207.26]
MLRDLSHKEDILNAFSGMLAVLNEYMEGDIINGIPAPVFDLAVLWAPAAKISRRGCQLRFVNEQGMTDTDFPSWSWAGWTGPVEYRLLEEMLSTEEALPTPLIPSYIIKVDGSVKTIATRTQRNPAIGGATGNNPQPVNVNENLPWPVDPLAANLLRFTAPCVPLSAFTISWTKEPLSSTDHTHISTNQFVYHILDRNGKRCRPWWYQAGCNHIHPEMNKFRESKLLFAGVSQHIDTYRSRRGPSRVEGEIRIFDDDVYPAVGKGSGLINALMIGEDWYHGFAKRISAARIHVKVWEEAKPEMRLIQMI